MKIITTSWDDGDVLDFRLADLLNKYNLQGTFYIPQFNAERPVMSSYQILELSKQFEIGGHSLHHVDLNKNSHEIIEKEITGSFLWLKELIGYDPTSFCFPKGKYNASTLSIVSNSGYRIARTTELLSIAGIYNSNLVPTTLQVFNHPKYIYYVNTIKRRSWLNMIRWLRTCSINDILKLTDAYVNKIIDQNGCFHLWGHSWEIDSYGLWNKLEIIFKKISHLNGFEYLPNKELLHLKGSIIQNLTR